MGRKKSYKKYGVIEFVRVYCTIVRNIYLLTYYIVRCGLSVSNSVDKNIITIKSLYFRRKSVDYDRKPTRPTTGSMKIRFKVVSNYFSSRLYLWDVLNENIFRDHFFWGYVLFRLTG